SRILICLFFSSASYSLHYLHSFPTRRSSDLLSTITAGHENTRHRSSGLYRFGTRALDWRGARRGHRPDEHAVRRRRGRQHRLSRSEEHTSELQSLRHLVCRLLLEKKKTTEKL